MPGSPTSTMLPPSAMRWTAALQPRSVLGGLRGSFTQVRGKALGWRGKVRQGGVPPSARFCQRMRCRTRANAFRMRRCQTEFRSDLPCCCCRVRSLDARKRRLSGRTAHKMARSPGMARARIPICRHRQNLRCDRGLHRAPRKLPMEVPPTGMQSLPRIS
jgi:hypothetical protein